MAKLNQLLLLEQMFQAYDSLNINDKCVIQLQGMCIERLVDEITSRLDRMLTSKTRLSCRNVLVANYETMTDAAYWMKSKLFSDLPKAASRVLKEKMEQMVYLLKALMLKIVNVDADYAHTFFEKLRKGYKQKRITDYELWKAQQSQQTIERLREYQTELTANMLIMGVLKYDDMPSGRELEDVDMVMLKKNLKNGKMLPEDFALECAKVRRYSHWEGERFVIDYELLRKYMFQNFGRLTAAQRIALFDYDVQMRMIHEDMKRIGIQQKSDYYSILKSEKAMKYWKRLIELGLVDNNCQLLPETSRQQAMYIVEPFAEKLGLKKLWKPFEDFWGIKNLAQEKWRFQQTAVLPPIHKEIDKVFED